LSSNLVKSQQVVVKGDGKRVIDTNDLVAKRLNALAELMAAAEAGEDGFIGGFSEGLDVVQMDPMAALMADRQDEEYDNEEVALSIQEQLDNANMQAQEIINQANTDAEMIIEGAKVEAENIMANAQSEGHQEGYNAGYREGLAKAKAAEDEVHQMRERLTLEYEAKIAALEPRFVDILTRIYDNILHADLSKREDLVFMLLHDAIRDIDSGKNFIIHVSDKDYTYVNEHKEELLRGMGSNCSAEIIEDVMQPKGECYIECEGGIFDCGLGTQMENLKKELLLMAHGAEE